MSEPAASTWLGHGLFGRPLRRLQTCRALASVSAHGQPYFGGFQRGRAHGYHHTVPVRVSTCVDLYGTMNRLVGFIICFEC